MATEPLDTAGVRDASTGAGSVPVGTDIGHVHLEVTDLDATAAFYDEALGMDVRARHDGAVFLAAGGYHHHVGVNVWNRRSEPACGRGLAWFELELPDEGAVTTVRDRLARNGYAVESTTRGVTVTDPDGITIRLRA
jgi:catechol 2,3-dioxygenase